MPGPRIRLVLEALFLILVAIGAGFARFGVVAIVFVMSFAWVIVALIERAISLEASRKASALRAAEPPPESAMPEPPSHVHVLEREPDSAAPPSLGVPMQLSEAPPPPPVEGPVPTATQMEITPVAPPDMEPRPRQAPPAPVAVEPEPQREPEPVPAPEPAPEPEPEPPPEPEPEPEPEPVPAPPVLASVPALPPEPVPPPPPEQPQVVVPFVPSGPRVWNLWELERLARDRSGADAVRDEERSFMLMYLREFAAPDGSLPGDFDSLVRESFGDLMGAAT